MHIVVQNGRLFQQEYPDVPVILDRGRILLVDLEPERVRQLEDKSLTCYGVAPLGTASHCVCGSRPVSRTGGTSRLDRGSGERGGAPQPRGDSHACSLIPNPLLNKCRLYACGKLGARPLRSAELTSPRCRTLPSMAAPARTSLPTSRAVLRARVTWCSSRRILTRSTSRADP